MLLILLRMMLVAMGLMFIWALILLLGMALIVESGTLQLLNLQSTTVQNELCYVNMSTTSN